MQRITFCATLMAIIAIMRGADACTGITLKSKDNSVVVARTVDWSGTEMNNMYAIVPRGHNMQSLLPGRQMGGLEFSALYGLLPIQ